MYLLHQFGLHELEGVKYLVQNRRECFNFIGLKDNPKVSVAAPAGMLCPHRFTPQPRLNDEGLDHLNWVSGAQFVNLFLPKPRPGRLVFVHSRHHGLNELAKEAAKLSCMQGIVTSPIWGMTTRAVMKASTLSNISPIVLTGARFEHTPIVTTLKQIAESGTRPIIVVGSKDVLVPKDVEQVEVAHPVEIALRKLATMNMPALGWEVLRNAATT